MAPHIDRAHELIAEVENDPNQYLGADGWRVWQERAEELAELLGKVLAPPGTAKTAPQRSICMPRRI